MHFRGFFIVVHLLFIAHSVRSTYQDFELDQEHYSHKKYDREQMSAQLGFPENTVISRKDKTVLSWTRVYTARNVFCLKYTVTRYVLSGNKQYDLVERVICPDQQAAWDMMHDCFVNRKKDFLLSATLEGSGLDQKRSVGSKKIPASSGCC